jgi:hypothetical protein
VKGRLGQIIEVLCDGNKAKKEDRESLTILSNLETGKISVEEAIKQMEKE